LCVVTEAHCAGLSHQPASNRGHDARCPRGIGNDCGASCGSWRSSGPRRPRGTSRTRGPGGTSWPSGPDGASRSGGSLSAARTRSPRVPLRSRGALRPGRTRGSLRSGRSRRSFWSRRSRGSLRRPLRSRGALGQSGSGRETKAKHRQRNDRDDSTELHREHRPYAWFGKLR